MDQQIADFENKKRGIRKYIKHLDDSCKSYFGPKNKYNGPMKNPYTLKDVEAYKARALGNTDEKTHIKRSCKFLSGLSKETDRDRRFFKEASTEAECNMVNGFWDPDAVNRNNKFDLGVCWYTDKDRECGEQSDVQLLRPYHSKFKDTSERRIAQSEKCNEVPGCSWKQQTGYTWDCVKGTKAEELGPSVNPPDDMPAKDGLEEYIFRWYSSETSPLTTELIGEGNRCQGAIVEESADIPEKLRVKEYIDFRLLNPENERDAAYLKSVLNARLYDGYIQEWSELQRIGAEKFNKLHKGASLIDSFYTKMDYKQFMEDVPVGVQKKAELKGMFPSVPQSVVNMMMKRVAQTDGERRGMLAWHSTGSGKCHAKDTPILMYDGSIKMVQDIKKNDVLMGDDSTPRRVLSLASGQDEMYDIIPTKGEKYTVNAAHILCLKHTVKESVSYTERQKNFPYKASHIDNKEVKMKTKSFKTKEEAVAYMRTFTEEDKIVEIEVQDYLKLAQHLKTQLKGYRKGVEFKHAKVDFDPYIIGAWLGDGTSSRASITNQDARILHYLRSKLKEYNLNLSFQSQYDYNIVSNTSSRKNAFLDALRKYNLINNKHIPKAYKINDRVTRLAVLAGLLDTDGSLEGNCYDIVQKSKQLSDDIVFLARSLGFAAYQKECTKSCVYKGEKISGVYYRVSISGEGLEDIPVKVLRKKASKRMQVKDALVTGIKVQHIGRGDYYGFTLDGNNRYLLGDFTVTHNTCTATGVMDSFWDTDRPIIFASSIDAIASNPDYKFHECAMNLFPRFQQGEFKGATKAESMALIDAAFKKRNIKFLSFAKLSNRVVNANEYKKMNKIGRVAASKGGAKKPVAVAKQAAKKPVAATKAVVKKPVVATKVAAKAPPINKKPLKTPIASARRRKPGKSHAEILEGETYVDLENAVLIIDEVHNLFRPLPNQKKQHELLEKEILDPRRYPNMKIVILTATPGDNIPDVLKLLNIIRSPKDAEIKLDSITSDEDIAKFKDQIRGMVSYFDMSNDTTKFPIVNDKQEFIKVPMGETQFSKYIEAYKAIKGDQKNYEKLAKENKLSKYWEGPRKYSNMLFNFDKDMGLSEFSNKMPFLLENIAKFPNEKHYVYSAFYTKMGYGGQGIVGIAKEMEKKGYKKLDVKEAKKYNAAGKLPPPGKRYVLAITTEIGEEGGSAGKNLGELIKIYNSPANKNGELIHVMLASQGFNEGIDLKAVRHIHFFEPLVTMASDKQTLGRAARYCSHADLDRAKGEWVVQIHRYMSDKPALKVAPDNSQLIAQLQMDIQSLNSQTINDGDSKKDLQEKIKQVKKVIKDKTKKKESVREEEREVYALERLLENIAKNKDASKGIKEKIKEKEKDLKALLSGPKKKNTLDPKSVDNIEEIIFKESRERMKELLTVYQCMKEAAVDCKILSKFHSLTGHTVKCAF